MEFVLTTPKNFYRIHTMIESGLIFFLLSPCRLLVCDGELSMSCIPPYSRGKKRSIGQSMDLKKYLFNKLIDLKNTPLFLASSVIELYILLTSGCEKTYLFLIKNTLLLKHGITF